MVEDSVTEEEMTSERTPRGLLDWVEAKIDQVVSTSSASLIWDRSLCHSSPSLPWQ